MTKNLLSKFKKSVEASHKVVHTNRFSSQTLEEPEMQSLCPLSQSRHDVHDRSQFYRNIANNYETAKMLKKIPVLVSENQQLKQKIIKLQEEMMELKQHPPEKHLSSPPDKQSQHSSKREDYNYIKIEEDSYLRDLVVTSTCGSASKDMTRFLDLRESRNHENSQLSSAEKKKKDLAKISSEVIHFFQGQIEQLKFENERLLAKYNQAISDKKCHINDIDKIKNNFEQTLVRQDAMLKKQQKFYDEKVQQLETRIAQLEGQNEIIKLQNSILKEQLSKKEDNISKDRKNIQKSIVQNLAISRQTHKHSKNQLVSLITDELNRQTERSNSANRFKFTYANY